jgi:iron(III) transport system substrate-binding protein
VDRDLRRQVEWIAHGRYPILIGPSEAPVGQLEREGVDLGRVTEFTDIGGNITSSSGNVMLVNRAPHPNAAKVFINWLLTRDGQTAFSTAFAYPSRRVDVPTDHLDPQSIPRPGGKYTRGYLEANVESPPELRRLLRELYGG